MITACNAVASRYAISPAFRKFRVIINITIGNMAYMDSNDPGNAGRISYLDTKKVDQVDVYHGREIADPYRWLEDDNAADTTEWVKGQNEVTFGYLRSLPHREAIRRRLTELWNYPRVSAPFTKGGKFFFMKNDGLQNQPVLYTQNSLDDEPRVLLDPNTFSEQGTAALMSMSVSDDGRLLAYALAHAGSDWQECRVRDVETGEDLPDQLQWLKFSPLNWTNDNRGFFYSRFPEPEASDTLKGLNRNHRIYYHRVGTSQSDDVLVFERPDHPEWYIYADMADDGRYLFILQAHSGPQNLLYVRDLVDPMQPVLDGPTVPVVDEWDAYYHPIGNDGTTIYVQTNLNAPRGRMIAIDLNAPERENWKTLIPEGEDVVEGVRMLGDRFVVTYMHNAHNVVRFFDLAGNPFGELELPAIGSVLVGNGKRDETSFFYSFSSFLYPNTIFRYDTTTGTNELFRATSLDFDQSAYETHQVWFTSKDGTRVPMFITHRRGLKLDGTNPTLLYGYGGFNVPLTPGFSVTNLLWMENGGVYAIANLRGGGEFGEEWYRAGTLERKQNVFDDFIAAAEFLIEQGYTSPKKLAIEGGSNGGLLVGAVMCQRPDLFGVALPAVGVLDMLRYHRFTIGLGWKSDYGISDDPEQFEILYKYSPLHNLKPGVSYPATLITTGDHDDRVVPAHSFKFAARLQECHVGDVPTLIRISVNTGHGAGKPISMLIEEEADVRAFLMANLGMSVPDVE